MYRNEMTLKRNFQKLRESPGVRYESVGRGFESLPSHQEKPVHIVCWFFFFVCAMEGARTGRRRIAPQAISPVGCCLARGFQRVGMSTMEAVNRKISWLFCFVSHECTVSARFLHGFCTVGVIHVRLCRALYCIAISALFLRQPEPRCNTLDFAGKVVCQRGAAAPLETQEKRPSTALLILGQCADSLAHGLDQRNDKRIPHGEIAQSFRHPGCPIIREAVEPFAFDGR